MEGGSVWGRSDGGSVQRAAFLLLGHHLYDCDYYIEYDCDSDCDYDSDLNIDSDCDYDSDSDVIRLVTVLKMIAIYNDLFLSYSVTNMHEAWQECIADDIRLKLNLHISPGIVGIGEGVGGAPAMAPLHAHRTQPLLLTDVPHHMPPHAPHDNVFTTIAPHMDQHMQLGGDGRLSFDHVNITLFIFIDPHL